MPFSLAEVDVLKRVYKENDFPSDRLVRDDRAMKGFSAELCRRLGKPLRPDEVSDEVLRIRKDKRGTGGLPPLGRDWRGPKFSN